MKKISEMSRLELAAFICTHLQKHGIEITLTGGSCVSIYSEDQYLSWDLDFIEKFTSQRKLLAKYLNEIDFYEELRHFKHQETALFIEFPPGPLAVGNEAITDIVIIETDTGNLRIISPTECVKDRLAAYYFWNDLQCLDQAVLVSQHNIINFSEVKRWSIKEGEIEKFNTFQNKLK